MKDFSQNGEQKIILDYFGAAIKGAHPNEPHTFRWLSIGENDGETFSNVRALALMGLGGVAVEPAEIAFLKLANNCKPEMAAKVTSGCSEYRVADGERDRIICINAAITTQDGPIDFYDSGTHINKGDTSLLSTTRPEELARWKRSGEVFTKTTVRGITFETLLKETGVSKFDFISIDAEGADLSILQQIDLTAVGCRMLCVEVNARGDREFTEYAARHGMRLHWSSYENRIYVR